MLWDTVTQGPHSGVTAVSESNLKWYVSVRLHFRSNLGLTLRSATHRLCYLSFPRLSFPLCGTRITVVQSPWNSPERYMRWGCTGSASSRTRKRSFLLTKIKLLQVTASGIIGDWKRRVRDSKFGIFILFHLWVFVREFVSGLMKMSHSVYQE